MLSGARLRAIVAAIVAMSGLIGCASQSREGHCCDIRVHSAHKASNPGLGELSWMSGTWRGEFLGGPCEEIWSAPRDGVMMGMFRITTGNGGRLYELMLIERREEGVFLAFRHFRPGVVPMDPESIELKLVRAGSLEAVFERSPGEKPARVRYSRASRAARELSVEIYSTLADGSPQAFTMSRAPFGS
ncbi:MAG: hypothetical protein KDA32_07905 [Phycisphaerales bacterium]|nr:hypothetical protein [Phycisphaerales bacterium]